MAGSIKQTLQKIYHIHIIEIDQNYNEELFNPAASNE